jgi:hypothetical protein
MVRALCVAEKAPSASGRAIDKGAKNLSELLQEKLRDTNSSCASDSPIKVSTGLETVRCPVSRPGSSSKHNTLQDTG